MNTTGRVGTRDHPRQNKVWAVERTIDGQRMARSREFRDATCPTSWSDFAAGVGSIARFQTNLHQNIKSLLPCCGWVVLTFWLEITSSQHRFDQVDIRRKELYNHGRPTTVACCLLPCSHDKRPHEQQDVDCEEDEDDDDHDDDD